LAELGPQSLAVVQTILHRAGVDISPASTLVRPGLDPVTLSIDERPPLVEVAGYRRSA
jgi:hypothetical protein